MRFFSPLTVSLLALTTLAAPALEQRAGVAERQKINPDLWPLLLRYTRLSFAAYDDNCTDPPYDAIFVKQINSQPGDTQANVYTSKENEEIIVSFRGTTTIVDIARDFAFLPWPSESEDCNGCSVHMGFGDAWKSIKDEVVSLVDEQLGKTPDYQVTFVGHSLGGSLTVLAYQMFKEMQDTDKKPKYKKVKGITLGQPRVGNQAHANHMDKLSGNTDDKLGDLIRITHAGDIVTTVPPIWAGGFIHNRGEIFQEDNPAGSQDAEHTYRCIGQEPADGNNGAGNYAYAPIHQSYSGLFFEEKVCHGGF